MTDIEVVYIDGMFGIVSPRELDSLIKTEEIVKFLRGDSWVYIGIDPTRVAACQTFGTEKRNVTPLN